MAISSRAGVLGRFATAGASTFGRCFSTSGKTVGVVGLGLMGHGIAQVSAEKGYNVVAVELEDRFLEGGMKRISDSVSKLTEKAVAKGKLDQAAGAAHVEATMGRITATTDRAALASCDVIVEAVIEDLTLKEKLYKEIGSVVDDNCVIASNTSSLPIGKMAGYCGRPKQMCGLHFFNPVQLMQLVEVIKTDETDPAVFARAMDFAKSLKKTPIECIDTPGFVVNRLLVPYICSALALVERGVASPSDVDVGMKLGTGHPMGPVQLADYVGLDTMLNIMKGWTADYPDEPAFFIPRSLEEKVAAGKLGRKTGEGFYKWDGDKLAD
jgi:3-hydroxyacyl-CoA dehydrogenase